jgi:metallophosphoesterase superfamily enzyme
MPAIGAFTGGLNVLDDAFGKVFPEGLTAFALGEGKVFVLSGGSLLGDVPRGAQWKL